MTKLENKENLLRAILGAFQPSFSQVSKWTLCSTKKKNWFFLSFYLKLITKTKEEWNIFSIHEKWTLVVKRRMASKFRQPIFSFDMDMDVDETPKKIKAGNILIERQTLFAINSNLFSCGKFITRYDDMLLQFRILRHCGQYSSAPSKMRLFCSLNHTYIFAS